MCVCVCVCVCVMCNVMVDKACGSELMLVNVQAFLLSMFGKPRYQGHNISVSVSG